jgi:hypothetical protein
MNSHSQFSKLEKSLLIICCILSGALTLVLFKWTCERVYLSMVAGKVFLLIEMEDFAKSSTAPREIALSARNAADWSKLQSSSSADIILTLVASNTVKNLRSILQQKTGQDWGENPREWVKRIESKAGEAPSPR